MLVILFEKGDHVQICETSSAILENTIVSCKFGLIIYDKFIAANLKQKISICNNRSLISNDLPSRNSKKNS